MRIRGKWRVSTVNQAQAWDHPGLEVGTAMANAVKDAGDVTHFRGRAKMTPVGRLFLTGRFEAHFTFHWLPKPAPNSRPQRDVRVRDMLFSIIGPRRCVARSEANRHDGLKSNPRSPHSFPEGRQSAVRAPSWNDTILGAHPLNLTACAWCRIFTGMNAGFPRRTPPKASNSTLLSLLLACGGRDR